LIDPDERTLEQFRRRLAGLEGEVPDPPPLLGMDDGFPRLPLAGRPASAELRPRNVYGLLAIVLVALVAVALPYAVRPQAVPPQAGSPQAGSPQAVPLPSAPLQAVPLQSAPRQSASGQPQASVPPVVRPSAQPVGAAHCTTVPEYWDAGGSIQEQWAGADWALIGGRLQAEGDRLALLAMSGPFAGPLREVTWPDGYSEWFDGRRLVLLDDRGEVVAGEHSLVMIGIRGRVAENVVACGIRVIRVVPPY
jgi:hypothetical protein